MPTVEFPVPSLGQRSDLNDREMPTNALRLLKNMMRDKEGHLSVRPGYLALSATNPATRIMGLHYFQAVNGDLKLVAGTPTKIWKFDGSIWTDITGTALGGGTSNHVRFTTFFQTGVFNMVAVNGVDVPKKWDGSAGTCSALGGTPGISIDVTVLGNRLLLLQAPNKLKYSDFNAFETHSSLWEILLVDSGDLMIGMQRVNRTSVAVLGQRSQWTVRTQTGTQPYRAERISEMIGPVSSAAIVKANSLLYYLAEDFNVYVFDGATPAKPVGWAMLPWVKDRMSEDNYPMSHGTYIEDLHTIFWFFPEKGMSSPSLGIFLDVFSGEMGRLEFAEPITASALARLARSSVVTWASLSAYTWAIIGRFFPTWDSLGGAGLTERVNILGSLVGVVHAVARGNGTDNANAMSCAFEFPLKDYGGWDKNMVPKVYETFWRKTASSTIVNLAMGTSDTLMEDPTYVDVGNFDLAIDQRNDIDLTSVGEKRFVSLRHSFVAADGGPIKFLGGLFEGETTDLVKGPENS